MSEWSRGQAASLSLGVSADRFENPSLVPQRKRFVPMIANATAPAQVLEETEGHSALRMLQASTAYRMCLEYIDFPNT